LARFGLIVAILYSPNQDKRVAKVISCSNWARSSFIEAAMSVVIDCL